jgi:hypothetical protein
LDLEVEYKTRKIFLTFNPEEEEERMDSMNFETKCYKITFNFKSCGHVGDAGVKCDICRTANTQVEIKCCSNNCDVFCIESGESQCPGFELATIDVMDYCPECKQQNNQQGYGGAAYELLRKA